MQNTLEHKPGTRYEGWFTNPMIRKIMRVDEVSEDHVTYSGIATKIGFFMLMVITGMLVLSLLLGVNPQQEMLEDGSQVSFSMASLVGLGVSALFLILTPLLAMIIKKTIPVTGSLFCVSVGYTVSFIAAFLPEYRELVMLAIAVTAAIVAVMGLVYGKGWIKVDDKFRSVAKILFFASIAASLVTLVMAFIPSTRGFVTYISTNPVISIGLGLVYVVIASLFLLVDFNAIQKAVDNKLPVKYEWVAAFGLAFSVIWLFFKVLDLLMSIKDGSK